MKKVIIIGSGFSGLASASILAKNGFDVTVLEKNTTIGGRARQFSQDGFVFDMGPSWYWMPDVFERFYGLFGHKSSDFYNLVRLDPSYQVVWEDNAWPIPANMMDIYKLFESVEPGSSEKLKKFLSESQYKYQAGIGKFVHLPGKSIFEYLDFEILNASMRMDLFTDITTYIKTYFKDSKLIRLLEFPVLFLGAMPQETPALYSLMNYADFSLGTWYPQGGMFKIVEAFENIARKQGVKLLTNAAVTHIETTGNRTSGVWANGNKLEADFVISSADYHHTDTKLLDPEMRQYSNDYWDSRKMAPSSLLYYLGLNKKVKGLLHHNLFFDADFQLHATEIYKTPKWPSNPLFYVSVPSITDYLVAPQGYENMFILIPTAPGIIETPEVQQKYFDVVMERVEKKTGENLKSNIIFRRDYATSNFIADYNALKGNAYGLANTLLQTGPLKPSIQHKRIENLFFAGQLTVPGPGVPPSIISGELAAKEVIKACN
ncbi:MAG: phytoene desaturase family protein [Bacteroidota bacterium]|nr:phytoene desaturase family protein [Bacteroidota bacterium]